MMLVPRRRRTVSHWEPLAWDGDIGEPDPFEEGSFMAMKNRCASTETVTWWQWLGREWFRKDIERFDPPESISKEPSYQGVHPDPGLPPGTLTG